jgi:protein-disulfide isomerase
MTRAAVSRRGLLGLGALSLGAVGLGAWLRRGVPLGEDIADRLDVAEIASQPGFPGEGAANAAITMLVFSDYACGVCRQVEPWWREAVRAAGDVRVIHRDWPILGPQSLRAARLALAAAYQRRYLPVHNALMRSPGLSEAALRIAVADTGVDWGRLTSDVVFNARAIDDKLARTAHDALRLGFRGTPGFLIGPIRIEGGASERQFADAIDRARERRNVR